MDMKQAMRERHMVRKYTDKPIPEELADQLNERMVNAEHGLGIRLMLDDAKGIGTVMKATLARNVRNYLLLAGPDKPGVDERLGYCGCDVMLYAQTLGLNSWWCGGLYNRSEARKNAPGLKTQGVIAVGFGQSAGVPHKSKAATEVARYEGDWPRWFAEGVEALLLAPTAMNRQAFDARGIGDTVSIACDNGAFSEVDRGIGTYHFELGAGKDNFKWA